MDAVEYPEVGILITTNNGKVDVLSLEDYSPYREVTCTNIQELESQ